MLGTTIQRVLRLGALLLRYAVLCAFWPRPTMIDPFSLVCCTDVYSHPCLEDDDESADASKRDPGRLVQIIQLVPPPLRRVQG